MLDFLALALGLALPWAFGIALLAGLYRFVHKDGADPPPASWLVGCGWFVGMFLLTLAMRGLSAAGIRLGIASVGVPLLVVTTLALIVGIAPLTRRAREHRPRVPSCSWRPGARGLAADAMALARCLARRSLRAAARRSLVAAALSVGCVDAMGHEGARLVRAGTPRPVRGGVRMAERQPRPTLISTRGRTILRPCRCSRYGPRS